MGNVTCGGLAGIRRVLLFLCYSLLSSAALSCPSLTPDGSTKPIEGVQPGDLVLSRSEKANADGKVLAARVTSRTQREHAGTLVLHLAGGQTVETTPEHLLFVDGKGFVPAGRLAVGNAIVTRAGPAVKIERVERRSATKRVFNFEVEGTHTYFVGKAGNGLWVHNTCPGTSNQFGMKFGQHMDPNLPGYRTPGEYRALADSLYDDPDAIRVVYPEGSAYPGETHIMRGNDLLRLDPDGQFRSLYPGAYPPPGE